jgi:uncharacterized protein
MIQFLIHAFDHTDSEALNRRMAVRPAHFENIKALKESGNFILGAALLNAEGNMIGSNMVMQFETEAEFQAYLSSEPYVVESVWNNVSVHKVRVAQV